MGLDNGSHPGQRDKQVIRVLDTSKETKCQRSGEVEYFQQEPHGEPKVVANDSGA